MRFTKSITTVLALTLGGAAFSADAQAGHRHRHHHGGGDAVAAGILGFGAGAILGGALAQPRYGYYPGTVYVEPEPIYVQPAPVYVRPAPVYVYEPWSPGWYDYCEDRYRSFNPSTGYFVGHDGEYHLCR